MEDQVALHYGQSGLADELEAALLAAGTDTQASPYKDMKMFDEFHIRGHEATEELAEMAGLMPGESVLDLGSGIGGPARTLAMSYGCRITGIDLVEEYCETARRFTERVGLSDRVTFRQGSITALPIEDGTFDVVWSQHVNMNIEDKTAMMTEAFRVLRPGGRYALYEICAGAQSPIAFPVPWAGEPTISFLVTPDELRGILTAQGFRVEKWRDVTVPGLDWINNMMAKMQANNGDGAPPLGIHLIMGKTAPDKARNLARNLEEDRIRVIQAVLTRPE